MSFPFSRGRQALRLPESPDTHRNFLPLRGPPLALATEFLSWPACARYSDCGRPLSVKHFLSVQCPLHLPAPCLSWRITEDEVSSTLASPTYQDLSCELRRGIGLPLGPEKCQSRDGRVQQRPDARFLWRHYSDGMGRDDLRGPASLDWARGEAVRPPYSGLAEREPRPPHAGGFRTRSGPISPQL